MTTCILGNLYTICIYKVYIIYFFFPWMFNLNNLCSKGNILINFLVDKVKFLFLFLVAHPLALSHLLNVVHAYQNPISPLVEDDYLFGQLLLIVHGSRNTEPFPPFEPWLPAAVESWETSAPRASLWQKVTWNWEWEGGAMSQSNTEST